ncbi:Oidioi.mRNA.OKI2018_I69.chr2.g8334.t1.cds [Oikopleura dioica]|uniref:Oidioi.mRNA.OKI2018_I69.chr2.g8334.t1.cds n=1 Tax=Oikopleura dioica TaxID=34765 RepID=A0ABN7TC27_OIKDI|nr:Oidioi.mRNA.OKI2018_I69.chr2.g8334.t1.cds [Oikopleura dioica]
MNDFMVFAAAMENLVPAANSCKKKQEPEPPYQEQRDIDFSHYFWPKRIVESIMGSQNEGSIQSMHPYRNNENRKVTMSTPCAALSMEETSDCFADYLIINYGEYTSGKLCGTSANIYEDWTFHFGSSFDITFYTDCSETGYGFFIEWQCSETEPAHPIDVDDEESSSEESDHGNTLAELPLNFHFQPIDLSHDTPSRESIHVSGEVYIAPDEESQDEDSESNSEASGDHDYSETSSYDYNSDEDSDSSSYD